MHWLGTSLVGGVGAAALALLVLCGAASPAAAQVQTQIVDLNTEALDAYQNLDLDTAAAKLQEALSLAEQAGYAGPEVARTLINLGIVFVAGFNDPQQGVNAFVSGLCLQPSIQLDPLLSTPDVQQVFLQAQSDVQAGACGGAAAPAPGPTAQQPPARQFMPGPQPGPTVSSALDNECPPGMTCESGWGGDEETDDPGEFARFFVNVQFVTGFAWVQSGMETDRPPPLVTAPDGTPHLDVFEPPEQRQVDVNRDGMLDERDVDNNGQPLFELDQRFNDDSAWIPDADSFDDFSVQQPVSPKCEADDVRTGPTDKLDPQTGQFFTTIEPSRYCARVESPGFVTNLALRFNVGYWLLDDFALSLPVRFQFDAGEGSLSNLLVGLRGELMLNDMESATGVPVSWFFGGTYGQIQAQPPAKDPNRPAPYVVSGPIGVHTGVNVRIRLHRNFGFIISPEVDVLFPDFLFNGDVSLGIEGAY